MRPLLSFQPLRSSDLFDLWTEARSALPFPGRRAPWTLAHLAAKTPTLTPGEHALYELRLANFSQNTQRAVLSLEIFEVLRFGWRLTRRFPLRLDLAPAGTTHALLVDDEGGRLSVDIGGVEREALADFVSNQSASARGLYIVRCRSDDGRRQALHVYQHRRVRP